MTARGSTVGFAELFDLPVVMTLTMAANALGVCTATASRLIRSDAFPCTVLRVGRQYRIPTAEFLRAIGVHELPVYGGDDPQERGQLF